MAYSAKYNEFFNDKRSFFSVDRVTSIDIESRVHSNGQRFLANNRLLIEQDFNQSYKSLKKLNDDRQAFWLYCYYCAVMLQTYYAAYGQPNQAQAYAQKAKKLKYRCDNGAFPENGNDETFLQLFKKKLLQDLRSLASTPLHISKVREWIGFINLYRIHAVFSRLSIKQVLVLAKEMHWVEMIDKLLGRHVDVDRMIAIINAPAAVFNVLSVGIFASRFFINSGMLLKHTFAPTEEEKRLSMYDRFCKELYKRHCDLLNDFVWGSINGITNYSFYFKIAAPVANWITAGFLFFDMCLLLYRRQLAEKEYLVKQSQYLEEKKQYQGLMQHPQVSHEDLMKYQKHGLLLDQQLIQLEINWKKTSATFLFNAAGAALLMGGFSASLLLAAAPAAVAVCYLLCTLAVAMYLSGDMYGKYKEKSLILKQYQLENSSALVLNKAQQNYNQARTDFIMAMVKNTVMPLLIVTAIAVCWQAAIVIAAVYIGYECLRGYFTQKNKEQPALPPPAGNKHQQLDVDSPADDAAQVFPLEYSDRIPLLNKR